MTIGLRDPDTVVKLEDDACSTQTLVAERKYLPTIADLIDRLSICLLKSVFIERKTYQREIKDIEHDIDIIIAESDYRLRARDVRAILVIMLANRYIWENEANVRAASTGDGRLNYDDLRATHTVNGVRNTAKNIIMQRFGGRRDHKVDCLAADLPPEFGNWRIFDDG